MAQRLKRLPAMQETWVRFLGWEDPLEKEMATHSSILAWRIPCTAALILTEALVLLVLGRRNSLSCLLNLINGNQVVLDHVFALP